MRVRIPPSEPRYRENLPRRSRVSRSVRPPGERIERNELPLVPYLETNRPFPPRGETSVANGVPRTVSGKTLRTYGVNRSLSRRLRRPRRGSVRLGEGDGNPLRSGELLIGFRGGGLSVSGLAARCFETIRAFVRTTAPGEKRQPRESLPPAPRTPTDRRTHHPFPLPLPRDK